MTRIAIQFHRQADDDIGAVGNPSQHSTGSIAGETAG
jgi:hypothetical protein